MKVLSSLRWNSICFKLEPVAHKLLFKDELIFILLWSSIYLEMSWQHFHSNFFHDITTCFIIHQTSPNGKQAITNTVFNWLPKFTQQKYESEADNCSTSEINWKFCLNEEMLLNKNNLVFCSEIYSSFVGTKFQ